MSVISEQVLSYEQNSRPHCPLPAIEPLSAPLHSAPPTPVFHHLTGRASCLVRRTSTYCRGGTPYRQFLLSLWQYAVQSVRFNTSKWCQIATHQMRFSSSKCTKTLFPVGVLLGELMILPQNPWLAGEILPPPVLGLLMSAIRLTVPPLLFLYKLNTVDRCPTFPSTGHVTWSCCHCGPGQCKVLLALMTKNTIHNLFHRAQCCVPTWKWRHAPLKKSTQRASNIFRGI